MSIADSSSTIRIPAHRLVNEYQKVLEAHAPTWQRDAACANDNATHLDKMYVTDDRVARENRTICFRCPVRIECLEYAVVLREPYGIWGGTTERQRKSLYRELRRDLREFDMGEIEHRSRIIRWLQQYIQRDTANPRRTRRSHGNRSSNNANSDNLSSHEVPQATS